MNGYEKAHAICAETEEIMQQISPKLNFVIQKDILGEL